MTDRPSDEERADIEERVICEQPPQLKPSVPEVKTEEAQPSPSQYPKRGKRAQTNLDLVPIESSHVQHKYLVRRPRALQVRYHGRLIEGGDRGVHTGLIQEVDAEIRQQIPQTNGHRGSATTSESGHAQERSTDDLKVQRGMRLQWPWEIARSVFD